MDKANIIDEEVKKVVMLGFNTAQDLLKKHSKDLHKLAEALLKYETLTGEEIKELLTSKSFTKGKNDASSNYSSGRKTTL